MQKLDSVLLVDDDSTTNFLNARLLQKHGVTDHVLIATNGEQALAVLAQACLPPSTACPTLVLLDINMPLMSGIEFLEAYQPRPPAQPLIIVVLTTSMHARDQARLQHLPIADMVTKPLTKEKLNAILQRHFQRELPIK
jgi:CheY-like chemotaxis protein